MQWTDLFSKLRSAPLTRTSSYSIKWVSVRRGSSASLLIIRHFVPSSYAPSKPIAFKIQPTLTVSALVQPECRQPRLRSFTARVRVASRLDPVRRVSTKMSVSSNAKFAAVWPMASVRTYLALTSASVACQRTTNSGSFSICAASAIGSMCERCRKKVAKLTI